MRINEGQVVFRYGDAARNHYDGVFRVNKLYFSRQTLTRNDWHRVVEKRQVNMSFSAHSHCLVRIAYGYHIESILFKDRGQ